MKAQTPEQLIEEALKDFDGVFPCIQSGCGNDGVIPEQDGEGDWQPAQCEFCYKIRFPVKEYFIKELSTIASKSAEDTKRLDFLDKCNRGLNNRYGTNYGWELILNHNVTRLMVEGHISWVDLHDSKAGNEKLKSCRDAIDKKMQALSQPKEQQ